MISVDQTPDHRFLTSGRLLARNTIYNLIGLGAPMLVAIFAIPLLIRSLGMNRFGILNVAWVIIGYFSLFDLGLGRALTQMVAQKLGAGKDDEIPALVWTSQFLMLILGLAGMVVVGLLSPLLVHDILKIPKELQLETLHSFYLLAVSIPVVISTVGLRGILEAKQRFGLINLVRISMGVFTFAGPLLVLPFTQSLFAVVAVLLVGRLVAWSIHLVLCFHVVPALRDNITLQRKAVRPLLRFGSWMTVSNIVSPFMVYMDRFLIGALISMKAVAFYATPFEVVTKLLIIPSALVGVLFPAFATSFVGEHERTALVFNRGIKWTFLTLFPITLLIVTLANDGINLWLGAEFVRNSTSVLQWLTVGVFITSMGQIPFAFVQATGRPDLTAKLHIIELPFYLLAVWWLTVTHGIVGTAIIWVARVAVDTAILLALSLRISPTAAPTVRRIVISMGVALIILAVAAMLTGLAMKVIFFLMILIAFALAAWFGGLAKDERVLIKEHFKITISFAK